MNLLKYTAPSQATITQKPTAMKRTIALIAASLMLSSNVSAQDAPATAVEVAPVVLSQDESLAKLAGTVISMRDSTISAEISGRLNWLAEVGDTIKTGQVLASVDDHLLRLEVRNNEAQIKRIQADLNYQNRQQQRLNALVSKNSIAQSELDKVESDIEILRQDLEIAKVARDRSSYNLSQAQVLAPFTGIVAERTMNPGELTQIGSPLLRLVDTETLEISVNAPLRIARFNKPGSKVSVQADGRLLSTEIRGAVPVGDERSRMMELRLKLEDTHWLIGEAVTVELLQGNPEKSLNIPRDALVLRENAVYVYRVDAEQKAKRVKVIPGSGQGQNISVEGELEAGDSVVIRGAERLRDGQELKVLQASAG